MCLFTFIGRGKSYHVKKRFCLKSETVEHTGHVSLLGSLAAKMVDRLTSNMLVQQQIEQLYQF